MVSECLVYHTLDPNVLDPSHLSLRSKRFRLVSEQRKTEERDSQFMKQVPKNKNAIFRAVFDSPSSFFAPKPHGNACYAGYSHLHNRKSRILVHNRNNNPTLHKSHIVKVTIIIIPINRVIIGGVYMQLRMAGRGWSTVIESSDSGLMCRR